MEEQGGIKKVIQASITTPAQSFEPLVLYKVLKGNKVSGHPNLKSSLQGHDIQILRLIGVISGQPNTFAILIITRDSGGISIATRHNEKWDI